jgi:hypothetical protein
MKKLNLFSIQTTTFLVMWAALLAVLPGCGSTKPQSASFASVVIHNHSPQEVETVAGQVFRENGYAGGPAGPMTLLFQKEGTRANSLAYNGITDTYYGAQTVVRVRAEMVDLGGGSLRLQCQTYMVRNAGDSFFEEETRLSNLRGGPYQNTLDEIAKRLQ